ncbi:glycosyltransferase family 2 protein [Algibacter amylolyticus]|uniref:Glycosyltransferase family 2 protein n=1 Tax=Algibacter amylolyticus TaxID=1608400 RepID=A0A5M7BED0_9FLAO|nr:glycosyltransferase family A protein [Algibacter amylolyticus]KAA5825595.1 glycosyltransferase family 2 protein [Algibacter amylolyticus]MBB5268179.1 glycosyltransferase involved in cell wall biosynthesis [Algibacter amylolyticus]TSJ79893.1 glycosyltransferase family 2 protein [Algibacter amylolyticus]
MKSLTVFTPTYNRAFCLGNCYNSLVKQTNKDFKWLIIDDGSQDDTKALVNSWILENKIEIQYHYQKNQGMHSGHNTAYDIIDTELNVCIDSDDYMPEDAVEKILDIWNNEPDKTNIAGIIGLDAFKDGKILGVIPDNLKYSTLAELELDYKIKGDKKLVLRTDIVKQYPLYPITKVERLVPLGTLYLMIGQKHKFICSNEVFCVIEYLEDGSSKNILKQYKKSPNGFRYSRILEMKYSKSFTYTFTRAIHYISSCLFTKKWFFANENPKKFITLLALPFGILLHFYILYRIRK